MPDTNRLDPICTDCEDRGDGSYTCDPERPACPYRVTAGHAALAPQAGHGAR